jgi:small subunit ribosomal protein S9
MFSDMATKQVQKEVPAKKKKASDEKYFYAVGRRKTAVAQVRLYEQDGSKESEVVINDKKMKDYFPTIQLQNMFLAPLKVLGAQSKFRVSLLVKGGGLHGQADAARLAIARALVKFDPANRPLLKANDLLVRDAREVERKKPGLKKARRAPQWSKR